MEKKNEDRVPLNFTGFCPPSNALNLPALDLLLIALGEKKEAM